MEHHRDRDSFAKRRLLAFFERLAKDVNANSATYLFLLLLLYFLFTAAHSLKPFWYDELYTFYIAKQPTILAGWAAVRGGADLNPPLLYAAVHISQKIFGAGELATRVPSIVSMAIVFLALYGILKTRIGKVYSMCGAMAPLLCAAYWYASEARPTALVMAGAAVAMLSWQRAADPDRHRLWLAGITAGLGMALLSHCYGVFLAIPFLAGEIARSLRIKRIDWRMWIAFAASTPALLFYPALFHHSGGAAGHIFPPSPSRIVTVYAEIAGDGLPWIALALLILIWLGDSGHDRPWRSMMPSWESAWLMGAMLIPAILVAFTMATHRVFAIRYALVASVGLSILLAHAFHRVTRGDERAGSAVLLLFIGAFIGAFVAQISQTHDTSAAAKASSAKDTRHLTILGHPLLSQLPDGNEPLVVATGPWFLEVDHYAPPEIAARLYSLSDPAAAIRFTDSALYEGIYGGLVKWFPIRGHLEKYSDFVAHHDNFLVYGAIDDPLSWLLKELAAENARIDLIANGSDEMLVEVHLRKTPPLPGN